MKTQVQTPDTHTHTHTKPDMAVHEHARTSYHTKSEPTLRTSYGKETERGADGRLTIFKPSIHQRPLDTVFASLPLG